MDHNEPAGLGTDAVGIIPAAAGTLRRRRKHSKGAPRQPLRTTGRSGFRTVANQQREFSSAAGPDARSQVHRLGRRSGRRPLVHRSHALIRGGAR